MLQVAWLQAVWQVLQVLPQVAWQWRQWARLPYSTGGVAQMPTLAAVVLGIGVMALHSATDLGYVTFGVGCAVAAVAVSVLIRRRPAEACARTADVAAVSAATSINRCTTRLCTASWIASP